MDGGEMKGESFVSQSHGEIIGSRYEGQEQHCCGAQLAVAQTMASWPQPIPNYQYLLRLP